MSEYIKEACVESTIQAVLAQNNGANIIELCANLSEDGLTPAPKLIIDVQSSLDIPVKVMIRPRSGNFEYNTDEITRIKEEIELCKSLNVVEIVFGACKDGQLDIALIKKAIEWAFPMKITIHKAIDVTNNIFLSIDQLNQLDQPLSILSSGGQPTAFEGLKTLQKMKDKCSSKINLIAAGKITFENIDNLHKDLLLRHYHGRNIVKMGQ